MGIEYITENKSRYSLDEKGFMKKNGQVYEDSNHPGHFYRFLGITDFEQAFTLSSAGPAMVRPYTLFELYQQGKIEVKDIPFDQVKSCLDEELAKKIEECRDIFEKVRLLEDAKKKPRISLVFGNNNLKKIIMPYPVTGCEEKTA